jgi:hypothetical protein
MECLEVEVARRIDDAVAPAVHEERAGEPGVLDLLVDLRDEQGAPEGRLACPSRARA